MAAKKNSKKSSEKKLYKKKDADKSSVKKDLPGKADDKKPVPGTNKEDEASAAVPLTKIANPAKEANKAEEDNPEERDERDIDEEEDDSSSTATCRCMEIDGDYYCFKMKQGRWVQFSLIPHPTKKICEASCCSA